MKKTSQFIEEIDSEWEDFIKRRKDDLPVLPKIEHHGHGHGHHDGKVRKFKISLLFFSSPFHLSMQRYLGILVGRLDSNSRYCYLLPLAS